MENKVDPISNGHVFLRINGVYQHLGRAEKRVANFIKNYPEEVVKLPINVLASKIGVSGSTVIRLCKKVGVGGYTDLKLQLAQDLVRTKQDTRSFLEEKDGLSELFNARCRRLVDSIESGFKLLTVTNLIEAAQLIQKARSTLIIGTGGSAAIAKLFNYNLIKQGFNSQSSSDFVTIPLIISRFGPEDVLFAVSHSGATDSVDAAVRLGKAQGCKVIGLTNYPESVVAKQSDVVLTTAVVEASTGSEGGPIRVAQIAVIDSLCLWLDVGSQKPPKRPQN